MHSWHTRARCKPKGDSSRCGSVSNTSKTVWACVLYLRLCSSRSSVSKSSRGCWVSLGPWDCSTDELEEMTVVWPDGWMVLNWNWGPIHKRLWGPVWVTISTCKHPAACQLLLCAEQKDNYTSCKVIQYFTYVLAPRQYDHNTSERQKNKQSCMCLHECMQTDRH